MKPTQHYDAATDRLYLMVSPLETDRVVTIPGFRFDSRLAAWVAPASWATALATRGVFGDDLVLTDEAMAWGWRQRQRVDYAETIRRGGYAPPAGPDYEGEPWWSKLDPDQITSVVFKSEMEQVLDCSELGSGKTVTTIMAVERARWMHEQGLAPNPFPVLVIATNSMKFTWADEIEKWADDAAAFVLDGSKAKRLKTLEEARASRHNTWVIVNWEGITRGMSRQAGYGSVTLTEAEAKRGPLNDIGAQTVIVDEAHRMKDPKAKQTRAAWALQHDAYWRFSLTATPMANEPGDVWAIMHGIDPKDWSAKTRWIDRYTISVLNPFGGLDTYGFKPDTRDELNAFLMPRYVRFPKPASQGRHDPQVRWAIMGPTQLKAYKAMKKDMLAKIDDEIIVAPNPLTHAARLSQFASATPVLGRKTVQRVNEETGETWDEEVVTVAELSAPSCKLDVLREWLEEGTGDQIVVFADSRKLVELCERELKADGYDLVTITGMIDPEQRKINVDQFQHGDAQVALLTLGAGSESITLTAASTAMFLQRSYRMLANVQAEGRIDRRGQSEKVQIIDVITKDSAESKVHDAVAHKGAMLDQMIRDREWWRALLK